VIFQSHESVVFAVINVFVIAMEWFTLSFAETKVSNFSLSPKVWSET